MLNGGYRNPEAIAAERELASLEAELAELRARREAAGHLLGDAMKVSSRGPAAAGFVAGIALGFSFALLVLGVTSTGASRERRRYLIASSSASVRAGRS